MDDEPDVNPAARSCSYPGVARKEGLHYLL